MKRRAQIIIAVPLLLMAACVYPYYPPEEHTLTEGFLVVDGFVDGVKGKATVQLKRSVAIAEYRPSASELNADVSVESDDGSRFKLNEKPNGLYEADDLDLNASSQYRLHIETQNGADYSSDFITLKQSPAFDTLFWEAEDDGLHFYVNGHDDADQTHYYRYLFTETWEYRVPVVSHYKKSGDQPVKRKYNELVDTCWNSASSTNILLKSTKALSRDLVSRFPLYTLKKGSTRLGILYSVMAEQRAVSEDEYLFWDLVRRTTETTGGLFDPTPSSVLGNIHNNNNGSEPVLGYFSGGFPQQRRIFIEFDDLPQIVRMVDPQGFCGLSTWPLSRASEIGTNVWVEVLDPSINLFYIASAECADCRSLGGDTTKPKFWPR
jgi:hypothetical protein